MDNQFREVYGTETENPSTVESTDCSIVSSNTVQNVSPNPSRDVLPESMLPASMVQMGNRVTDKKCEELDEVSLPIINQLSIESANPSPVTSVNMVSTASPSLVSLMEGKVMSDECEEVHILSSVENPLSVPSKVQSPDQSKVESPYQSKVESPDLLLITEGSTSSNDVLEISSSVANQLSVESENPPLITSVNASTISPDESREILPDSVLVSPVDPVSIIDTSITDKKCEKIHEIPSLVSTPLSDTSPVTSINTSSSPSTDELTETSPDQLSARVLEPSALVFQEMKDALADPLLAASIHKLLNFVALHEARNGPSAAPPSVALPDPSATLAESKIASPDSSASLPDQSSPARCSDRPLARLYRFLTLKSLFKSKNATQDPSEALPDPSAASPDPSAASADNSIELPDQSSAVESLDRPLLAARPYRLLTLKALFKSKKASPSSETPEPDPLEDQPSSETPDPLKYQPSTEVSSSMVTLDMDYDDVPQPDMCSAALKRVKKAAGTIFAWSAEMFL